MGRATRPLFSVSADGTFEMSMSEAYCRGAAGIFSKSGRKEARGDRRRATPERSAGWREAAPELTHIYFMPVQTE